MTAEHALKYPRLAAMLARRAARPRKVYGPMKEIPLAFEFTDGVRNNQRAASPADNDNTLPF